MSVAATTDRPSVLVLIAEDEQPIAEVVAMVVEDAGYTPVVAAHGRQALEMAHAHRPALLITDLMMPYLSGLELIAALRSEDAAMGQASLPVILMTAASPQQARAAGADAVLRKPFDLEELEALVRQLVGVRAGDVPDGGF